MNVWGLAAQHMKRSKKGGREEGLNNSPDLNAKSDGGVGFFAGPKTSRDEQQNVDSVQSISARRATGQSIMSVSSLLLLPSAEDDDDDVNKL